MGGGDWEYQYYQSLVEKITRRENVDQILMVGMGDVYDENRIVQAIDREKSVLVINRNGAEHSSPFSGEIIFRKHGGGWCHHSQQ
jgi:hypothetical protein